MRLTNNLIGLLSLLGGTVFVAASSAISCGGSDTGTGSGGSGGHGGTTSPSSSPSSSSGPVSGTGGFTTCENSEPDGKCNLQGGEDCECEDCKGSAFCNKDQCVDDGVCDTLNDSCICPDCDEHGFCADPSKHNCNNDGSCNSFLEGCTCPDCWTHPLCADNVAACHGGVPDGVCDRATETCDCVDCHGTAFCVPCEVDGVCGPTDPCSCSDCYTFDFCVGTTTCADDGICAIVNEGCYCADCINVPECAWALDGGVPEGGTTDGGDGG